jgi:hypothetical protein
MQLANYLATRILEEKKLTASRVSVWYRHMVKLRRLRLQNRSEYKLYQDM